MCLREASTENVLQHPFIGPSLPVRSRRHPPPHPEQSWRNIAEKPVTRNLKTSCSEAWAARALSAPHCAKCSDCQRCLPMSRYSQGAQACSPREQTPHHSRDHICTTALPSTPVSACRRPPPSQYPTRGATRKILRLRASASNNQVHPMCTVEEDIQ